MPSSILSLKLATLLCALRFTHANQWGGANSYYLHHYPAADQTQVLDAMQAARFKAIRIFINPVIPNQKGTGNPQGYDVENPVGTWNDQVLDKINSLMYQVHRRGMKLIIALHDRYSLGCWEVDAYQAKYNIPRTSSCGDRPEDNDLSGFYRSAEAAADMDRRFAHILAHKNPNFGNRPWSNIPEAILGFNVQNEGQAHQRAIHNPDWICDRARRLKPQLAAGILVMTGGGADVRDSVIDQHFRCPAIDVVTVHSYSADWATALPPVIQKARGSGKRIFVEEFGSQGPDKAAGLQRQIDAIRGQGVAWMVWQVNKPNNPNDLEVFTDDTQSWSVLSSAARASAAAQGAFNWPELGLTPSSPPQRSPPQQSPSPQPGGDVVVPCGTANADWNGRQCLCRAPNVYVNNKACCSPGGMWDDAQKKCVCTPGTTWNDVQKRCVSSGGGTPSSPPPVKDTVVPCGTANADWDGRNCLCRAPNSYVNNKACCSPGGMWDDGKRQCVCTPGTAWNEAQKACIASRSATRNGNGHTPIAAISTADVQAALAGMDPAALSALVSALKSALQQQQERQPQGGATRSSSAIPAAAPSLLAGLDAATAAKIDTAMVADVVNTIAAKAAATAPAAGGSAADSGA